jgi:hypothetical protein
MQMMRVAFSYLEIIFWVACLSRSSSLLAIAKSSQREQPVCNRYRSRRQFGWMVFGRWGFLSWVGLGGGGEGRRDGVCDKTRQDEVPKYRSRRDKEVREGVVGQS